MSTLFAKALSVGSGMVPLLCIATTPTNVAATNCAKAEAASVDARLAATRNEIAAPLERWYSESTSRRQMVVQARDPKGRVVAQMLCTYDDAGPVVALHPTSAEAVVLDLNR